MIAVATDFPAITRPWLRPQERGECRVEFVEDRPVSDLTDDLVSRLDAHSSAVAVGWVQYATGTTIDVPRLRRATEAAGVRLILDASQGACAMRCDGSTWRADLMASSGYKWLGGPGGVAIRGARSPFAFDATRITAAEGVRRFTQSTMSYLSGLYRGDRSDLGDQPGSGRTTRDATPRPVARCSRGSWLATVPQSRRSCSGVAHRLPGTSRHAVRERLDATAQGGDRLQPSRRPGTGVSVPVQRRGRHRRSCGGPRLGSSTHPICAASPHADAYGRVTS